MRRKQLIRVAIVVCISILIVAAYQYYYLDKSSQSSMKKMKREGTKMIDAAAEEDLDMLDHDNQLHAKSQRSGSKFGRKDMTLTDSELVKETTAKEEVNVITIFSKAKNNAPLQRQFRMMMRSMFHFATAPLALHVLGDVESHRIAKEILAGISESNRTQYRVVELESDAIATQLHEIIADMQKHFTYKIGAYYSDVIFFLSIAIHRILLDIKRVIVMDIDMKFNADIKLLNDMFAKFSESNVIGLAYEQQPVYRHLFYAFRDKHPQTKVGLPPPGGLTGFNSGIVLLDLEKLRNSDLYNSLLKADELQKLTEKFMFKGHLGDQDFFTLVLMEYPKLFYVLPCTWNRQLCQWWRNHGYQEIAESYFKCEGDINLYHGNCKTEIPEMEWEKQAEKI